MIWLTIVLSMIAGFTIFWAGVVSLIGFGGWKQLATYYPAGEWPQDEGVALSWQTMSVGAANYGNVLNAVVTAEGLYLRPARLFSYNHPPVFIPWGAIVETSSGLFGGMKLQLEDGKAISLRGKVVGYVGEAMAEYHAAGAQSLTGELLDEGFDASSESSGARVRRRSRA